MGPMYTETRYIIKDSMKKKEPIKKNHIHELNILSSLCTMTI